MSNATVYDVIIIGAGLAGLAAGLRAKQKGYSVLIIEKNDRPGGKIEELKTENYRFDTGPSLFTEPHLVDELFELFNKDPRDYFQYKKHDESCRYFFQDGTKIILEKDSENDQHLKEDLRAYVDQAEKDMTHIGEFFLDQAQSSFLEYFKPSFLKRYPYFLSKRFRKTLAGYNASMLKDDKLRLIFNRFGTYNGSDPYQMSGLYSMISALELNRGTYFPTKGMRSIIDSLYRLAQEESIDFLFNRNVKVIQKDEGYIVKDEDEYLASKLICAIDHLTFYKELMPDPDLFAKYESQERSSSGLVLYLGINKKIPGLGLHNIIFSQNYRKEFKDIFVRKELTSHPTLYIHDSSVISEGDAPAKGHNLFVMINTPAYKNPGITYRTKMKTYVLSQIRRISGVDITDSIVHEEFLDNERIEEKTGSYLGALYGASANKITSTLSRHPNQVKKYKNLYFCGGTVHPGGGIPLVLRSAKIIGEKL